jgi:hypothetical protein
MNIHFQEIEPEYGIGYTFNVLINGIEFEAVSEHVEDGSASTLWNFCKALGEQAEITLTGTWSADVPWFAEEA